MALELGNPAKGSLGFMVWNETPVFREDRVLLMGPDVPDIKENSAPLAQVVLVAGEFDEEYECYQDLKETIYETRLEGYMARILPSRNSLWARISKEAFEKGFSLGHLGWALISELRDLEFVSQATVLYITAGKEEAQELMPTADEAARVAAALVRMNEEMSWDCDTCDYQDVCDTVAELKSIRRKLKEGKA